MVKKPCESRLSFVRCTEMVEGKPDQVFWRCEHCKTQIFKGAQFRSESARIHLAADKTKGVCAKLCSATDAGAPTRQLKFRKLIQTLRKRKEEIKRKRKQQALRITARENTVIDLMNKKKKKHKQITMPSMLKSDEQMAADLACAEWAIAHDIPANALRGPYWKNLNTCLSQVKPTYTPMNPSMNPQKLKKKYSR